MTTLDQRLRDLAQDAPHGGLPETDLWSRGKRRQRRRRAAVTTLTLVMVLGIGSLASLVIDPTRSSVAPADSDATAVLNLPDRLYVPSPWLHGTDDTGPIGPLVAVVGAERKALFGGSSNGLVAVSAAGDYAFLDLPDVAVGPDLDVTFALSDDGRFVGYAFSDGSVTSSGQLGSVRIATGLAVYDTVTGEVQRLPLRSEFGLGVDTMTWRGSEVVADLRYFLEAPTLEGSSARQGRPVVWDAAEGTVARLSADAADRISSAYRTGSPLVALQGRKLTVRDVEGRVVVSTTLDVDVDTLAVSPDAAEAVLRVSTEGPGSSSDQEQEVRAVDLTGPEAGVSRVVPGVKATSIAGWRDAEHAVLVDGGNGVYWSVDLVTGEREKLLTLPEVSWGSGTTVAADALQGPVVTGADPPRVLNPIALLWLSGLLGAGLVLLLALVLVRRRHRVRF